MLELATKEAERLKDGIKITPVLLTSYRDGAPMCTATCVVTENNINEPFPTKIFRSWQFACKDWSNIQEIYAPQLSSREQHRLDKYLHLGPKRMLNSLGFLPAEDQEQSIKALVSYRHLHRYYPIFRSVDE